MKFKDSKRIKNIYPLIYETDNLIRSQYNAQKGKTDRTEIRKFNDNISANLYNLYDMLESESYQPGEYRIKTIYEPKERIIMIAPFFPDRIIHHCIINVLGEIWTKTFISNTYACIKGRGIHKCMEDIHRVLISDKNGTKYCLKIDIKKFYDNVDHSVLKRILRYRIADKMMLNLLDKIIDSNGTEKGLPIGNFTSQYLANLYLSYFDHWMKEDLKVRYYYRYMDDIVILNNSKEVLRYYLDMMGLYLGSELKLEIKHNWQIFPVDARSIDYVGFKQNHYGVLLRKGILQRFYKKFNSISKRCKITDITTIRHLFSSEYGWISRCSEEHTNFIFKKCLQWNKMV
jgi:retron-type reverse transcriptase